MTATVAFTDEPLKTVRVSIVEDNADTAELLATLLDGTAGIVVHSTHLRANQFVNHLGKLVRAGEKLPDVVLMDIEMPGMNGIDAARYLREKFPSVSVLIVTAFRKRPDLLAAIEAGVQGFLTKGGGAAELRFAIRHVFEGRTYFGQTPTEILAEGYKVTQIQRRNDADFWEAVEGFTPSEVKVFRLLARGMSNAAIAAKLGISEYTVKERVSVIIAALDCANRTQVALRAAENQYR
ncbi:MAG: response regulator [Actinomycetaceae bacterium]|nr:response regulator [Actinomycetaceae bacterium]